jgi:hypothetical protein
MFEFFTAVLFLALVGGVLFLSRENQELEMLLSQKAEWLQLERQLHEETKKRCSALKEAQ